MANRVSVARPRSLTPAVYRAVVTSKMMHDYRVEEPATNASRLGLVWNQTGALDVVSIGSDSVLRHLYRDSRSATGWSSHDLNMHGASDLTVLTTQGMPDRLFAIGKPLGGATCAAEMIRTAQGGYVPQSLGGLLLFGHSLSVAPCGGTVVAVGRNDSGTYFDIAVAGILPHEATFLVRQGGAGLKAEKVVCLPRQSNAWPHLSLVTLRDGLLQSHRGMRETPMSGSEVAALPRGEAGPGDAATRYVYLDCDAMPLPALPNVTDFAAVITSENEAMLLATDGSSTVYMLMGALEAASPGLVRWNQSWQPLSLTGAARPSLSRVCAVQLPDGRTRVLLHESVSGKLWITGWRGPGLAVWDHAVNLGVGGRAFAASVSHSQEMSFATADPDTGIHSWTRTNAGGWRSESVHVAAGRRIERRCTRRTSLTITDDQNANAGPISVKVRAAENMAVTINGSTYEIGPSKPAVVQTRAGSVHVTTPLQSSLHVPELTFEADDFSGLAVLPDQDVQGYLKALTGQQLLDAVDPITGQQILRGTHRTPEEAGSVARCLREVAAMLDPLYAPGKPGPGSRLKMKPMRGVRVIGTAQAARPRPRPAWRLSSQNGRLRFRKLRPQDVEAARAEVASAVPGDFLGIDWGSVIESIVNAASDVWDVLVDGAEAVLTVIINGVRYVVRVVLETAEQIYDVVTAVLNRAGATLGAVIGWLMQQLGFVIDWDKIKRTRDRLRRNYTESVALLPHRTSDPATWEADGRAWLEQARTSIQSWIDTVRTQFIGQTPFNRVIGELPSLPSLFESGGTTLFPQATWLIDKAIDAVAEMVGELPALDIPGWSEAMDALQEGAVRVESAVTTLIDQLTHSRLTTWMADLSAFRADTVVAVLDLLAASVNTIVDVAEAVLHAILRLLHLAWANTPALLAWFDRTIDLTFFGPLYEGILASRLSLFDLLCLCIAVPFSVIESAPGTWPQLLNWVDFTMVCWVPIHMAVEAVACADNVIAARVRVLSGLMLLVLAGGTVSRPYASSWSVLTLSFMLIGGSHIVMAFIGDRMRVWYPILSGTLVIIFFIGVFMAVQSEETLQLGAVVLLMLSHALGNVANVLPDGVRWDVIVGYAALQGLLAFGTTAVYLQGHEDAAAAGAVVLASPA